MDGNDRLHLRKGGSLLSLLPCYDLTKKIILLACVKFCFLCFVSPRDHFFEGLIISINYLLNTS